MRDNWQVKLLLQVCGYTDCFIIPQAINRYLVYCSIFHLSFWFYSTKSLWGVARAGVLQACLNVMEGGYNRWLNEWVNAFLNWIFFKECSPHVKYSFFCVWKSDDKNFSPWNLLTICKRNTHAVLAWQSPALWENVWSAVQSCLKIFPPKYSHARNFFPSISNMAAAAEERNRSLKQALIESLTAILSPDQQARQQAEEQLKVLEVTEGKIISLLWIIYRSCAQFLA